MEKISIWHKITFEDKQMEIYRYCYTFPVGCLKMMNIECMKYISIIFISIKDNYKIYKQYM